MRGTERFRLSALLPQIRRIAHTMSSILFSIHVIYGAWMIFVVQRPRPLSTIHVCGELVLFPFLLPGYYDDLCLLPGEANKRTLWELCGPPSPTEFTAPALSRFPLTSANVISLVLHPTLCECLQNLKYKSYPGNFTFLFDVFFSFFLCHANSQHSSWSV